MPASKIVDEQEVKRWFEEGRTYAWMVEEYDRKYHVQTTIPMFANFRRRHGLARRITRDDALIPWEVKREHRWNYDLAMLRAEARQRAGHELTEDDTKRLAGWKRMIAELGNPVVHYDPDTEEGFHFVPRGEQDHDLIREPRRKTGRRNADNAAT